MTEHGGQSLVASRDVAPRAVDPFLRWAGGKRWLVPTISGLLGRTRFNCYHEPFLGGGAVFFALAGVGAARLADLNSDLVDVYKLVRDRPADVSRALALFENSSAAYYQARAESPHDPVERAARFIFLNHTSFNGIYRVNLRGEYNVPYGNRASVRIPSPDHLERASERLSAASVVAGDFERAVADVEAGDLVFLDPPYTVAHNNNGFVKYNQHLFSFEDQERLASCVATIVDKGAKYVLTNAAHESIDNLFGRLGRRVEVVRRNAVGGKQAKRGSAAEYLFTNLVVP